ncbi:MAG: hypothetical protein WCP69_06930 [Bacteroidota bacterium]
MENLINLSLQPFLFNYSLLPATELEEAMVQNHLSSFDSYQEYTMVVISETVKLVKNQNQSFLSLLNINYIFKELKIPQNIQEQCIYEVIGLTELRKDYGRVLIRPETIADKIAEIFEQVELDFDTDKEFSRKYYVLSNNESKFRMQVTTSFLNCIAKFDNLEIEINKTILIVRTRKPFSSEITKTIADFLVEINNGLN